MARAKSRRVGAVDLGELGRSDIPHLLWLIGLRATLVAPSPDPRLAAAELLYAVPAETLARCVQVWLLKADVAATVVLLRRVAEVVVQVEGSSATSELVVPVVPAPESFASADVQRVLALAVDLGVPVAFGRWPGARGRAHAMEGIVVDPDDPDLAPVLAHELGHALDHRFSLLDVLASRRDRERLADELAVVLLERDVTTAFEAERIARAHAADQPAGADGGIAEDIRLLGWWASIDFEVPAL
jgi:Zn-dependent protease with chaperone function